MKKSLFFALFAAVVLWITFAAVLLGLYEPWWLPAAFLKLQKPATAADFGQAFSALEGLVSSFALMIGLIAIIMQTRQNADANVIGGLAARHAYLLADCDRLEQHIQEHKARGVRDDALFNNMVNKKKRQLDEAKVIDARLRQLLETI